MARDGGPRCSCGLVPLLLALAALHCGPTPATGRTLLFLSDHPLNYKRNVVRHTGQPAMVASPYRDPSPDLCTNWGYPSVYSCPSQDGQASVLCMMYESQLVAHGSGVAVFMNVAQSTDGGVTWAARNTTAELPNLTGRHYFNQLLPWTNGSHARQEFGSVIVDPNCSASCRYRVFGQYSMWTSADGIRWVDTGRPWQNSSPDYPISVFYDKVESRWSVASRPINSDRRIGLHAATNNWTDITDPVLVLDTDAMDSDLAEFYGMIVFPLYGLYISMLEVFHVSPELGDGNSPHKYLGGRSDIQLGYSINGWHWQRTVREPFMRNGPPGSPDAGLVYTTALREAADGSLLLYASTSAYEHGIFTSPTGTGSGFLSTYRLRKHGFVYLESAGGLGTIGTRILYWEGGEAAVNVESQSGSIACQVTDPSGTPLGGYTFADAEPFTGDSVAWTPTWSSKKKLADLAGKGAASVIRLEFQLLSARIYAVEGQFAPLASTEAHGPFPPKPRPGWEPGW